MAPNGGYWGKMIEVDMTKGTFEITARHMQYVDEWIGARPLGMKMLWEALKDNPGIDPLGPDNVWMLIPGVVSGLPFCGASRYEVICKNGLTFAKESPYGDFGATVGNSAGGGQCGPAIRMAGYDMIYLTGKSATPKVLFINNDKVELLDGAKYAGLSVFAFEEQIKEEFGPEFKNVCCGPAAEAGVRFACTMAEIGRAAGRSGNGAVMWSKGLKGIVCYGDQQVPVADQAGLAAKIESIDQRVWGASGTYTNRRYGTASLLDTNGFNGNKPVRNHREGWDPFYLENGYVASETRYWVRHRACYACQLRCMKIGVVRSGKYKGSIAEGPEYESGQNISNALIETIEEASPIMEHADGLGFDIIGVGGLVAFALEAYENGVLTKANLGQELRWGNADDIIEFMKALCDKSNQRETIQWLRLGSGKAARNFDANVAKYPTKAVTGPNNAYYAMSCKGQEFAAWNAIGGGISRAQGYAISNRGACHVNGHNNMLRDIGTYCSFGANYGAAGQAELVNFILGFNWTNEQFTVDLAEKAWTLEKCFNLLNGFTRADDDLPARVFTADSQWAPHVGKFVPRTRADIAGAGYNPEGNTSQCFEDAITTYYTQRGWDPETGVPSDGRLRELGLNDVVPYLAKIR